MSDESGEDVSETVEAAADGPPTARERQIRTVVEHESLVLASADALRDAFEDFAESDHEFEDLESFWRRVDGALDAPEDAEESADPASAVVTVVSTLDPDSVVSLHDGDASDDLVSLLWELKLDYDRDLERQLEWILDGRNWWRHVRSTPEERDGLVFLEHELTVDHSEDVVFHSTVESTWELVYHLVWHVLAVPNVVGEETLLEMDKRQIGSIRDNLETAIDDIEDYEQRLAEEAVDPDGSGTAD